MLFFKSLLATASIVALAAAQTPKIAFTSVPAVVVAGQSYNVTWGGGDGTGVTLVLRQGDDINNLNTIGTIASNVVQDYYMWQVSSDLSTASNYALQIIQGLTGINYSGGFSLVGGTGTSSISYSGYTSATRAANATTSHSSTITGASAASMGTGTIMSRNTTFSSMSLTSSAHSTTAASSITAHTTSSASATTQSTSAPTSNAGASNLGSSAALVMGLLGAIMFLQ